jgi:hypothetical protein
MIRGRHGAHQNNCDICDEIEFKSDELALRYLRSFIRLDRPAFVTAWRDDRRVRNYVSRKERQRRREEDAEIRSMASCVPL